MVTIAVTQDPGNLGRGTVTLQGTGEPRVDGQPLPATITRRKISVERQISNLPAMCIDQNTTSFTLDLEANTPATLNFTEVRALDCPPGQDYCKGNLSVQLVLDK